MDVLVKKKEVLITSIIQAKLFSYTDCSRISNMEKIYSSICQKITSMPAFKLTENWLLSAENVFAWVFLLYQNKCC